MALAPQPKHRDSLTPNLQYWWSVYWSFCKTLPL